MSKSPKYLQVVSNVAPTPAAAAPAVEPPQPLAEPPEDFDEKHRAVWHEIVAQAPHLTASDKWGLCAMVAAVCLHKIAAAKVREYGSVIKSPSGYPIQSPYVSDMNKQAAEIRKWSSELGLTHGARVRGNIKKKTATSRSPFAGLKTLGDN